MEEITTKEQLFELINTMRSEIDTLKNLMNTPVEEVKEEVDNEDNKEEYTKDEIRELINNG